MSFDQADHLTAVEGLPAERESAPPLPRFLEDVPTHVRDAAALRGLGFSLRQISHSYGVTPQAISIMLSRQRALLKGIRRTPDLAGLSPRAVNALGSIGLKTRDEARQDSLLMEKLGNLRNCGRKTRQEILDWAGLAG